MFKRVYNHCANYKLCDHELQQLLRAGSSKKPTDLKCHNEQRNGEWLISAERACLEFVNFANAMEIASDSRHGCSILIPGVGVSKIGKLLFENGFTNLTLMDIEDEAIHAQQRLFNAATKAADVAKPLFAVEIVKHDVQNGPLKGKTFDFIIDKSFLDVFIANKIPNLGQKRVLAVLKSMLKPTGVLAIFSMHHEQFKRMLPKKNWLVLYKAIQGPTIFSRRKRKASGIRQRIACIYAKQQSQEKQIWKIGDRVDAEATNGLGFLFSGHISKVYEDSLYYDVNYDNGDKDIKLTAEKVYEYIPNIFSDGNELGLKNFHDLRPSDFHVPTYTRAGKRGRY